MVVVVGCLKGEAPLVCQETLTTQSLRPPPTSLTDSITQAVIKFPDDTQHHRICKGPRQKHKFNAPVPYSV